LIEKCSNEWGEVKKLFDGPSISFGKHVSYWFYNSPRHLLYAMAHYKFAAKMIGHDKRVLDVGCGEGLGTWLLAVECGNAMGIDFDDEAVLKAAENWNDPRVRFQSIDFLNSDLGQFDAVMAFDTIEHIMPENADGFFRKIADSLSPDGITVIGTPNITADRYASPIAKEGHVNMYSGERLEEEMSKYFSRVLMFGANDEIVHTGFLPMAHYLIAVGYLI